MMSKRRQTKQRLLGVAIVLLSLLTTFEGDATFAVFGVPFGLWVSLNKHDILY